MSIYHHLGDILKNYNNSYKAHFFIVDMCIEGTMQEDCFYHWYIAIDAGSIRRDLAHGTAYSLEDLAGQVGLALINSIPPNKRMAYLPQGDNGEGIYQP